VSVVQDHLLDHQLSMAPLQANIAIFLPVPATMKASNAPTAAGACASAICAAGSEARANLF
jgi:hypothetical protein